MAGITTNGGRWSWRVDPTLSGVSSVLLGHLLKGVGHQVADGLGAGGRVSAASECVDLLEEACRQSEDHGSRRLELSGAAGFLSSRH